MKLSVRYILHFGLPKWPMHQIKQNSAEQTIGTKSYCFDIYTEIHNTYTVHSKEKSVFVTKKLMLHQAWYTCTYVSDRFYNKSSAFGISIKYWHSWKSLKALKACLWIFIICMLENFVNNYCKLCSLGDENLKVSRKLKSK